ncbi:hypothetical protein FSP39_012450 [Pinctada imbricata]|uniref:Uncharacterized protein n=1 Tax=Pinctada imbricata TaxID=66713 RepID=A0AA89BZ96_PINIB|nr:hypothetical protein FSP39_012450 [Pinctada imbricata]
MPGDSFLEMLNVNSLMESPPVNNACIPDIYNKLDAETIEKTRVINSLLQKRLEVQQKVLNKYRYEAEKFHRKEHNKVVKDLRKVRMKLPYMDDEPTIDTKEKVKMLRMAQSHVRTPIGYTTIPREPVGISTEKDDRPFCSRFFTHHLPTKSKHYKGVSFVANKIKPKGGESYFHSSRSKDKSRRLLLSRGLSASENCLVAGSKSAMSIFTYKSERFPDDDEDAMTV